MNFAPEKLWQVYFFSPQNVSEISPRSVTGRFPLPDGPGCKMSPSALDRSKCGEKEIARGSERIIRFFFRSDRAFGSSLAQLDRKRAVGNFQHLGAWRSRKHPPDRSCREIRHILRRERPDQLSSCERAENCKSTNCKSHCIRSGRTHPIRSVPRLRGIWLLVRNCSCRQVIGNRSSFSFFLVSRTPNIAQF